MDERVRDYREVDLRLPLAPLRDTIRVTRSVQSVFLSILGLSWFWFFGSALLALLPTYTRDSNAFWAEHVRRSCSRAAWGGPIA